MNLRLALIAIVISVGVTLVTGVCVYILLAYAFAYATGPSAVTDLPTLVFFGLLISVPASILLGIPGGLIAARAVAGGRRRGRLEWMLRGAVSGQFVGGPAIMVVSLMFGQGASFGGLLVGAPIGMISGALIGLWCHRRIALRVSTR